MEKEIIKEGFDNAQKLLKEKQIEEVKLIVLETLKKIDNLRKDKKSKQIEVKELDEQIKILELDIEDLKVGRIDRIVERQEKDTKAKNTSVVVIIKEKEIIREPWYQPYIVEKWNINPITIPLQPTVYCTSGATSTYTNNAISITNFGTFTCSSAKYATIGTYDVNGEIINLR